jgi:hypothetical protein
MVEAQRSQILVFASRSGWPVQWIVEIDPVMKRLRLLRQRFGRWTKTMIDCSLDECVSVGTVEYSAEGHLTYGTYFKLKDGSWHAIPVRGNSFAKALEVVKQVSSATGIPRVDVKYS